jgi:cell division protein FtsL
MSTLTHRNRAVERRPARRAAPATSAGRRPYFVMNGATMVAIAAIALTVIGILYLIQTSEVAQLGYDMSRLQTQRDSLTLEISELEYEIARYESLQTIEEYATTRLGMAPMTNFEFVELQEPSQRNLTVPEPIERSSPSFFDRLFDALMGVGSAESKPADKTRYTLGERSQ